MPYFSLRKRCPGILRAVPNTGTAKLHFSVASQRVYEAEIARDPAGPIRPLDLRVHLTAGADTSALDVFLGSAALQELDGPEPLVRGDRLRSWQASGAYHRQVPARLAQLLKRVSGRLTLREGGVVENIEEAG